MRLLLALIITFSSCVDDTRTLPASTGMNSEVLFVVDDLLWNSKIEFLVSNIFEEDILGLPQKEAAFRIIRVRTAAFKAILKTHRNIVIITKSKKDSYIQRNKWSSGQIVTQLFWDGDENRMNEELKETKEEYIQEELKWMRSRCAKNSKKKIEKIIKSHFGIECILPKEYEVVKNEASFFWANYNPTISDEIKNIMIFSFIPKKNNLQKEILEKIDSVFAEYLVGEKEGSYVKIESRYPPYYFNNTYRGLWKLENGFMGGVFIAKTYFQKEKIIISSGIIFAPQSRKRKYVKELEAIL